MKNLKKMLAVLLTLVMVFSMTTNVFAHQHGGGAALSESERFNAVRGQVIDIDGESGNITVQTDTGEAVFVTWYNTYVIGEFNIGDVITGYVRPGIMTLQWPPHHTIDVIVAEELSSEIAVGRFQLVDNFYVSLCGSYRFSPEGVELILQDNIVEFIEEGLPRTMVVLHGTSNRDLPETLTNIQSVTVLFEQAVHFDLGFFEETDFLDDRELQRFAPVRGEVTEINGDRITIHTFDEDGVSGTWDVVFMTWYNTYVINGPVNIGDTVTGYVRPGPMTLQWPPHHTIDVIVVGELETEIAVARFELQLGWDLNEDIEITRYVSLCGNYQFFPNEIEMLLQDGNPYMEEGLPRTMVVLHGASDRMIPAGLMLIESITVLFEPVIHPPLEVVDPTPIDPVPIEERTVDSDSDTPIMRFELGNTTYQLHGQSMTAPAAPFMRDGRTMVPFRVIAEGLGADVDWNGDTRTITLTLGQTEIQLTIDVALPDGMGTPVLVGGNTFVPLRFVSESLGATLNLDDFSTGGVIYIHR